MTIPYAIDVFPLHYVQVVNFQSLRTLTVLLQSFWAFLSIFAEHNVVTSPLSPPSRLQEILLVVDLFVSVGLLGIQSLRTKRKVHCWSMVDDEIEM
jgi:hypothetical protein